MLQGLDTSLVVAFVGVGGTIIASAIGAYVNIQNTRTRQRQENFRAISDHYMEEKTKRLIELFDKNMTISSHFVETVLRKQRYSNRNEPSKNEPITEERLKKIHQEMVEFDDAIGAATVFLTPKQDKTVKRGSIVLNSVLNSAIKTEGGYEIDWNQVEENASESLGEVEWDALRKHNRLIRETIKEELNSPIYEIEGAVTDPESYEEVDEAFEEAQTTE